MSAGTHSSSLQAIADQITGWISTARIVLTCRQNLWDGKTNYLEGFDIYRTLEFFLSNPSGGVYKKLVYCIG